LQTCKAASGFFVRLTIRQNNAIMPFAFNPGAATLANVYLGGSTSRNNIEEIA